MFSVHICAWLCTLISWKGFVFLGNLRRLTKHGWLVWDCCCNAALGLCAVLARIQSSHRFLKATSLLIQFHLLLKSSWKAITRCCTVRAIILLRPPWFQIPLTPLTTIWFSRSGTLLLFPFSTFLTFIVTGTPNNHYATRSYALVRCPCMKLI